MDKRLKEELKNFGYIESENEIICPYCGFILLDSVNKYDKDSEFECPECSKISELESEHTLTFKTKIKKSKLIKE